MSQGGTGRSPITVVCAGGGGVGKTTTSAALALALSRAGQRTLVVTVDPARRLAQAMGVAVGGDVQPAAVEEGIEERLFALMPEPRASTRTFIDLLFVDQPEALERMLKNRVYRLLADAAAGMHEVVCIMLVAKAVREHEFDYLVIDTAPSRHALDFVSYPGRLAALYEGRAVGWLGQLARRNEEGAPQKRGGLFDAGRRKIEELFGRLVNPAILRSLADLFADLALVKDRFARLARVSESLLLGAQTRYLLVAAPSGSAQADVTFLAQRLKRIDHRPTALLLNRADPGTPSWVLDLEQAQLSPELTEALKIVRGELYQRTQSGDRLAADLAGAVSRTPQVRLPTIEVQEPKEIVRALATLLDPHLELLAGLRT